MTPLSEHWLSMFVASALVFSVSPCATAVPAGLPEAVRQLGTDGTDKYAYSLVDLNKDGRLDAVVLMQGQKWCGTGGCTMVVFAGTNDGFKLISRSTIANQPIVALTHVRHGWRTLVVEAKGRGPVLMSFDGKRYPLNPSVQRKASPKWTLDAQVLTFTSSE